MANPYTLPSQEKFNENQTGSVTRSIANKLAEIGSGGNPSIVSVMDFGAVGDGSTDDTTAIQNAINALHFADDARGNGGTVYFPNGVYKITTSLKPRNGVVFRGANADVVGLNENGGATGAIIKTSGAIWAFENSSPTTQTTTNVVWYDLTVDLTANASAIGAFNMRSLSWCKLYNVAIVLPATGSMEAVRFDAQDVLYGGFWNDLHSVSVYALGTGNSHIGIRWINGANSDTLYGGSVKGVATTYSLESGNGNTVLGGGTDGFATAGISLASSATVTGNAFINVRLENTGGLTGIGVLIGANAADNLILHPHLSGFADAAHELTDNSSGKNTVYVSGSGGGNAVAFTMGNKNQTLQVGMNKINSSFAGLDIAGTFRINGPIIPNSRQNPTYGASVAINNALGDWFFVTATNATPFTVANPPQSFGGQEITITISNTSGGALGAVTFDTWYKLAGAWVSPATANQRSIKFKYNGAAGLWYEVGRTAADVPN